MIETNYFLCGLPIRFVSEQPLPRCAELEHFRAPDTSAAAPVVTYHVVWYDGEPPLTGREVYAVNGYTVRRTATGWCYAYRPEAERDVCVLLEMPDEAGEARLLLPCRIEEAARQSGLGLSLLLGQDLLMVQQRRLILHASFIRWRGQGMLFTGPSGMGKSTQAALWETLMNAEVLNGDRAVCQIGDHVTAWGSPWAGSSAVFRNESAPLRAIVSLRQARENTLTPLYGREALMELMPRIATVPWAERWHMRAMDLAIELVGHVPVWRLACRPDREAVETVRQAVFGE